MEVKDYIQGYIDKARIAQQIFEKYSQEKVDKVVRAVGKAVYDNADELAKLAADETGLGKYEDKILKNKGKTKAVWNKIKNEKSRNIIEVEEVKGIIKVSKPVGVIGAILPSTNPTMTPAHNAMVALKGGNAVVFAPHPSGKKSGQLTVKYMRDALKDIGAPEDLLQIVDEVSLEISGELMKAADINIATGGPGMVKAAYSSGKPSVGVGAGNIQCIVDRDIEIEDYIQLVINGRTYDNGVLCTCEQTLIVPDETLEDVIKELEKRGGYRVPIDQVDDFRNKLFPDGIIAKEYVGATAQKIGKLASLDIAEDKTFVFVISDKYGKEELFSKEKLLPVLNVIAYDTFDKAIEIARTNLEFEGKGHSSVIHSKNQENIEKAGIELPVSRLAVNQQGSSGLGGAMNNGLNPTATLGCGSWGNNSLSENLWWHNLVNISRIAQVIDAEEKSDEEIWG